MAADRITPPTPITSPAYGNTRATMIPISSAEKKQTAPLLTVFTATKNSFLSNLSGVRMHAG